MFDKSMDRGLPHAARGGFITSAEVAERAGVSRSAVSRTFTPGASVSPEVKRRVIAAADELGYRVNRLARGLISARSNLVGLVWADFETASSAKLLARTTAALSARGLHALVFEFGGSEDDVREKIQRVLEYRVEAIVVMSGVLPASIIEECQANGVRVVIVNRPHEDTECYSVMSDDIAGGALAADRFIESGHDRLAAISSDSGQGAEAMRIKGFVDRARTRGFKVEHVTARTAAYEAGQAGAEALYGGRSTVPDAVFCATDMIAAGFMDAIRQDFNLSVPGDVSVIGYDDIPQAAWGSYQLTTLRPCADQLAAAVAHAVRSEREGAERVFTCAVSMVERGSTRTLARA